MPVAHSTVCPQCGRQIPANASEGLCPPCLVSGVLSRAAGESRNVVTGSQVRPTAAGDGTSFGKYILLGLIGQGGMGTVYRARACLTGREVALKLIRAGEFAQPEELRRFRLEIEAAKCLGHPGIVPVHEVGEEQGQPFFTMPLMSGGSLSDKLARGLITTGAGFRHAAEWIENVASTVQFAHERGVLHRDLKPANILFDAEGRPMVSDFGLAKLLQAEGDFTLSGALLGTPAYMAPEQAAGDLRRLTVSADIYSLGAILYHLLTGHPPFEGSPLEQLRSLAEEEPRAPCSLNESVPRDLETICLKCLEKDPPRRYASAGALAMDLGLWLAGKPIQAQASTPLEQGIKWARRKPVHAAATGLLCASLISFVTLAKISERRLSRERNTAVAQEQIARYHAQRAGAELARAECERQRAESNAWTTRLNLYAADISLAMAALADGNLGSVRRTLERHIPATNQVDLRGFEWDYLWHASRGQPARVLRRHTKPVHALAFSADGGTLLSGGRDGQLFFWDLANNDVSSTIPSDPPDALAERTLISSIAAVSPELLALLATGREKMDGVIMRSKPSSLGEVRAIALSEDGRWLATGGDGAFVRIWDAPGKSLKMVFPVRMARQLSFTKDNTHLIVANAGPSSGSAGEVRIYDLARAQTIQVLNQVRPCFALCHGAREVAVISMNGMVELYSLKTGKVTSQWSGNCAADKLAASKDGNWLAGLDGDKGEIHIWDVDQGRLDGVLRMGRERVLAIAFAPTDAMLATAGSDHTVRLWGLHRYRELSALRGHEDEVLALEFSPNGEVLASVGKDNTLRLWEVATPDQTSGAASIAKDVSVSSMDGRFLVSETGRGLAACFNTGTGQSVALSLGEQSQLLGFVFTNRIATLRCLSNSAYAEFWDPLDGLPEGRGIELKNAPPVVSRAAAAPVGICAVSQERGPVMVYDLVSGDCFQRLETSRRVLSRLLFSHDGNLLAAFSWPNQVLVWDIKRGKTRGWWKASLGAIQSLAFTRDGKFLATGGDDNAISIWDPKSGGRVALLRGHKAEIKALAFSPEGATLASSGRDLSLKLWHVPTWRELGPIARDRLLTFLSFTEDNRILIAHEHRGIVHQFFAPAGN